MWCDNANQHSCLWYCESESDSVDELVQVEVLTVYLTDLTLQTLPPPAGGAAVLTILNVMDLYGVTKENKTHNLTYHRFVEV